MYSLENRQETPYPLQTSTLITKLQAILSQDPGNINYSTQSGTASAKVAERDTECSITWTLWHFNGKKAQTFKAKRSNWATWVLSCVQTCMLISKLLGKILIMSIQHAQQNLALDLI